MCKTFDGNSFPFLSVLALGTFPQFLYAKNSGIHLYFYIVIIVKYILVFVIFSSILYRPGQSTPT
jgi:hypothetical protein